MNFQENVENVKAYVIKNQNAFMMAGGILFLCIVLFLISSYYGSSSQPKAVELVPVTTEALPATIEFYGDLFFNYLIEMALFILVSQAAWMYLLYSTLAAKQSVVDSWKFAEIFGKNMLWGLLASIITIVLGIAIAYFAPAVISNEYFIGLTITAILAYFGAAGYDYWYNIRTVEYAQQVYDHLNAEAKNKASQSNVEKAYAKVKNNSDLTADQKKEFTKYYNAINNSVSNVEKYKTENLSEAIASKYAKTTGKKATEHAIIKANFKLVTQAICNEDGESFAITAEQRNKLSSEETAAFDKKVKKAKERISSDLNLSCVVPAIDKLVADKYSGQFDATCQVTDKNPLSKTGAKCNSEGKDFVSLNDIRAFVDETLARTGGIADEKSKRTGDIESTVITDLISSKLVYDDAVVKAANEIEAAQTKIDEIEVTNKRCTELGSLTDVVKRSETELESLTNQLKDAKTDDEKTQLEKEIADKNAQLTYLNDVDNLGKAKEEAQTKLKAAKDETAKAEQKLVLKNIEKVEKDFKETKDCKDAQQTRQTQRKELVEEADKYTKEISNLKVSYTVRKS